MRQRGSCLCGAVRYEFDAPLAPLTCCHCAQCRKASGTAFAVNVSVPAAAFRFLAGEALLGAFESSPGVERCFCSRCGSPILKRNAARPDNLRLRVGSLDTDPGVRPGKHIHMASRASWYEPADALPRHDEEP